MKTNPRHAKAAFTLIELMAVITIIVILAGLVIGGMGYVTEKQAKSKATVQIALLSKALEEYKLDMGTYPLTADKSTFAATSGTATSPDLYIALFYEGYDYAVKSSPATWVKAVGSNTSYPKSTKIYVSGLDPTSTKQGWVASVASPGTPPASTPVLDPWGNQYCYRTAVGVPTANDPAPANAATQNPDFDLWSMGKDGKTKPGTPTDATNRDDIKNF